MKLLSCSLTALSAVLFLAAPLAHAADPANAVCMTRSEASVDALAKGDYAAAGVHFSPATAKALDTAKLKQAWTELQTRAGDYRMHAATTPQTLQGKSILVTPITFAKMQFGLLTACDAQGRIGTYRFAAASMIKLLESSKPAEPVQAHVEAGGVRVQPMSVASPPGPLTGVLTLPAGKGPFPAVVLVSGSGANDFDETIGPNKPFRDIALGLARAGIASLRYNKRTHDYPRHWGDKDGNVIDAEVTHDAVTAVHALAKVGQVDPQRVFVLGHSLGAMMAPRIGSRDPQLAGLVLMAAPARPILEVLKQQARDQTVKAGGSEAAAEQAVQSIEKERQLLAAVGTGQSAPKGEFFGGSQAYWLSWSRVDPLAEAKTLPMPMLILQGGSDFQVSPALDFARWKQVMGDQPRMTIHLYPGLSHLFMPAGKTGTVADYQAEGQVDAHVIGDIVAWIKATPPARH
jgi:dienelactone hydrolase